MALIAVVLWRKSGQIAAIMVGHDLQDAPQEPEVQPRPASLHEIHAIAFSTVGLLVLVWGVTDMAGVLAQLARELWIVRATVARPDYTISQFARDLTTDSTLSLIGLCLLLGASGFTKLLRRTRDLGLEERERPDYPTRGT